MELKVRTESEQCLSMLVDGEHRVRFTALMDDAEWEMQFKNGLVVGLDPVSEVSIPVFVKAMAPDASASEMKQVRKMLKLVDGDLLAAIAEVGIEIESNAERIAELAGRLWSILMLNDAEIEIIDCPVSADVPSNELGNIAQLIWVSVQRNHSLDEAKSEIQKWNSAEWSEGREQSVRHFSGLPDVSSVRDWVASGLGQGSPLADERTALYCRYCGFLSANSEKLQVESAVLAEVVQPWFADIEASSLREILDAQRGDTSQVLLKKKLEAIEELDAHKSELESDLYRLARLLIECAYFILSNPKYVQVYLDAERLGEPLSITLQHATERVAERQVDAVYEMIRSGQFGDAYRDLHALQEKLPIDFAEATGTLGLLEASGHPAVSFDPLSALRRFQKAAELQPEQPNWHYYEGVVLEWLEQFSNAQESYEAALRLQPNYKPALQRFEENV